MLGSDDNTPRDSYPPMPRYNQTFFHYGYFVVCRDGKLSPSGDDWNRSPDSYTSGQSLGIKGGVEAIVVEVIKGQEAALNNLDIMVLLEERRAPELSTLAWVHRVASRMAAAKPRRMTSRPQIQTDAWGEKMRAVGNRIFRRPADETFQEFQINYILWQFEKNWFDSEMAKPLPERHIILQWRHERCEQLRSHPTPDGKFRAPMTGGSKALQVFADDLYQLAHASGIPKRLVERLKNQGEFQGARYEVFIASMFARCGFQIEFIDDQSKRNPEFIALKGTELIAVEAKSRRRPGALHEIGEFSADVPSQVKRLYESALGQNPGGMPFLVFVDVNLPLTPTVPLSEKTWVGEAMQTFEFRRLEERDDSDTALILTNFGWHFSSSTQVPPAEYIVVKNEKSEYEIPESTWTLLLRGLSEYGLVIDEERSV
jgi:hypothetical protein